MGNGSGRPARESEKKPIHPARLTENNRREQEAPEAPEGRKPPARRGTRSKFESHDAGRAAANNGVTTTGDQLARQSSRNVENINPGAEERRSRRRIMRDAGAARRRERPAKQRQTVLIGSRAATPALARTPVPVFLAPVRTSRISIHPRRFPSYLKPSAPN